jgi:hypothetical protein
MKTFISTILLGCCVSPQVMLAQQPIVQTKYTADPAPMVYNDRVYLYTTHDEDNADGFLMKDWLLYSSSDMVNWTDHGAVASLRNFAWYDGDNGAWAEQVIHRNGKFYMYCPIHGHGIGVLVSDTPYGPFVDPLGHPLVWQREHWDDIDPTVWIDTDGQAYMYWGNPNVYYVKLNENMISYSGDIVKLPYIPEHYQEGPWLFERNDKYYLAYAATCCPEGIGYAMSDSPTGPWVSPGYIMRPTDRTRGNHPGIIEFRGKWYVFGLNYDLMHRETYEHHERRSVSVAEMHFRTDGTIEEVPYWLDNAPIEPTEHLNPYCRVEAETMAWGYGLKTIESAEGIRICNVDNGEYIMLRSVDFGEVGAKRFVASVASTGANGVIELRIDSLEGKVIGTLKVGSTGSFDSYATMGTSLKGTNGVHDLYLCFKGADDSEELFRLDWWQMSTAKR